MSCEEEAEVGIAAAGAFEQACGYRFADPALLVRALTHTSFAEESSAALRDNQRLEFLGDSVVGLVVAHALHERHPDAAEGVLSKLRSRLVSAKTLAALARERGLGRLLRLGRGEERTSGRQKTSLLAVVVEALVGAVYLDGGLHPARAVVIDLLGVRLDEVNPNDLGPDYKSALQEWAQGAHRERPSYELVGSDGPAHDCVFTVRAYVLGAVAGEGRGRSKKEAEQRAAKAALQALTDVDSQTKKFD